VIDRAVENMRVRLERLGGRLEIDRRLPHEEPAIAEAIRELVERGCSPILILGASAIVDRGDVVPRSVVAAGGEILRLGIPVDPGNLLLLARIGEVPLLGVPGCARSLARSGFDQVLERLLAGIQVDSTVLSRMGSGGLLGEISTRPQPRSAPRRAPRIAAVVLAAGESRRMEGANKLLVEVDGRAVVSWVVEAVRGAGIADIYVVVGHQADEVRREVGGAGVTFVENEAYATGMASSLRAGVAALPEDVDAALICLGDMPRVTAADVLSVTDAFDPALKREICIPTYGGRRGHPVLFAARFLPEIERLRGDVGARSVIERHPAVVHLVPVDHPGVLLDVDTPQAFRALSPANLRGERT
jgi:molybdenum cofactor cytidylyltransferase